MTENPFQSNTHVEDVPNEDRKTITPGREAYNVVTDTITGVNVRWSDNKFQAIFVLVSVLMGALLGSLVAVANSQWRLPWYGGALFGAFGGLVVGIFGSGIFLMIYRAYRHINGKHD